MKRSSGKVSITVDVKPGFIGWWDALTPDQRNSIRDRIDSIADDLNEWTP